VGILARFRIPSTNLPSRRLLHKLATIWESLPPHVRYTSSSCEAMSPHAIPVLIMLRLEYLYTEFLLHKLIVNRDHTSRGALIQTSHQILGPVLSVFTKRPITSVSKTDLEWTVNEVLYSTARSLADFSYRWSTTQCRAPAF